MITYELAKELEEAGFPLAGDSRYFFDSEKRLCNLEMQMWSNGENLEKKILLPENSVYIPTLSELIEACGDRFHALENKSYQAKKLGAGIDFPWLSYSNEDNDLGISAHIYQQGSTPEEAVARLWLALNKK